MPDEKTQVQQFMEATRQLVADREARGKSGPDKGGPKLVKTRPVKPE